MDSAGKGFVSIEDLAALPELENNPLRYHIGQKLAIDNDSEAVDFNKFLKMMLVFKSNDIEKQYKCESISSYV